MDSTGKHFVFVHGSCHGGWCWYKVAARLKSAGHKATALDLAASGVNQKQVSDIHTFSDYLEPLLSFMEALPSDEKVILVGHSRGGLAIAVAMERFPKKVSVGVYVTALMPGPGFNIVDINNKFNRDPKFSLDSKVILDGDNRQIAFLFGPMFMATKIYNLSPPEDLTLATLLARPYPYFDDERSVEESKLTEENYGSVRRVYIIVADDAASLTEEKQRMLIKINPPDEVMVIYGADHMVMMSKPQQLFSYLHEIALKYY